MAVKSKAPAKSTKAAKTKAPSKAKTAAKSTAAKSTASKSTASRKTVTKLKSKTTAATKTKKPVAASTRKTASAKPAAKKAAAPKKTTAKKSVAKKAATVKSKAKSKKPVTAAKTKAKTAVKKAPATTTKAAAKPPAKKAAKRTKRASRQTAASRKAVLTAAAKRFQSTILAGQKLNVSGSTRATAMAAAAKPKKTSVRALAASISSPSSGKKISTPASDSPKEIDQKTAAQKKSVSQRHGFKTNEQVVYPAHGVGKIIGIEEQEIAGMALELFVIHFEKEKLTLRVPTGKLESVGMRKLSEDAIITKSMTVLKGRARVKRTMWSRRAQEYVAKINSGDLVQIAEVVRDLYRSEAQPEQSYSERQLYEDALDRMAREVAAVDKLDERGAVQRIVEVLSKSARNRRALEESKNTEASDETKAA